MKHVAALPCRLPPGRENCAPWALKRGLKLRARRHARSRPAVAGGHSDWQLAAARPPTAQSLKVPHPLCIEHTKTSDPVTSKGASSRPHLDSRPGHHVRICRRLCSRSAGVNGLGRMAIWSASQTWWSNYNEAPHARNREGRGRQRCAGSDRRPPAAQSCPPRRNRLPAALDGDIGWVHSL